MDANGFQPRGTAGSRGKQLEAMYGRSREGQRTIKESHGKPLKSRIRDKGFQWISIDSNTDRGRSPGQIKRKNPTLPQIKKTQNV